ncbi:MAG: methyltransferase domain-containing protein [Thiobacillaceae bacterium]|jgi:SAM-dependent methyltransferase|nr:methyltransferase domain-containing protein [Thiobacillaceae bacterium]
MNDDLQTDYLAALIALHRGLDRQGPGDADFARALLRELPPLPGRPRIADLGCGAGAGALLLAEHFRGEVMAVDVVAEFVEALGERARRAGLDHLITPIVADMAALDWPPACLDLLWSEGAAYNLGFERALRLWRPLLAEGGIAVVSELSWFTDAPPEAALAYWRAAYPGMGDEAANRRRARAAGYEVLTTSRLPGEAWWRNYYDPLRARLAAWRGRDLTPAERAVLRETEAEMDLFARFSEAYGYTFYVLRAAEDGRG